MDFCKYHPLAPATFTCGVCHVHYCDTCVDEGDRGLDPVCFHCNRQVESLGAVNHAVPFWRRIEDSFRYPLTKHSITLILVVSVFTSVLLYIPFGFALSLMLSGAFIKYCFSALENTAQGLLKAPDITEAYGGGVVLILRLLLLFILLGAIVSAAYYFIGPRFASALGFLMVLGLPAVIIIFSMSDSLVSALNPVNILHLITAIGLPYGLLLAFIMIMFSSVGLISAFMGEDFSLATIIFQSIISNYYSLVLFHIMGYMIFQYQGELGFVAREDTGEGSAVRTARDRLAANIDVHLKEGEYNTVVELMHSALKKYPNDKVFNRQYFEFIFATQRLAALDTAATAYLEFLIKNHEHYQLSLIYKRALQLLPDYLPNSPWVRYELAQVCHQNGDPKTAVRLINGMHKTFPDFGKLPEAFNLMADALEDLPNKHEQALQCRDMAKRLAEKIKKSELIARKSKAPPKAVFNLRDSLTAGGPQTTAKSTGDSVQTENAMPKDLPPIEFK